MILVTASLYTDIIVPCDDKKQNAHKDSMRFIDDTNDSDDPVQNNSIPKHSNDTNRDENHNNDKHEVVSEQLSIGVANEVEDDNEYIMEMIHDLKKYKMSLTESDLKAMLECPPTTDILRDIDPISSSISPPNLSDRQHVQS